MTSERATEEGGGGSRARLAPLLLLPTFRSLSGSSSSCDGAEPRDDGRGLHRRSQVQSPQGEAQARHPEQRSRLR